MAVWRHMYASQASRALGMPQAFRSRLEAFALLLLKNALLSKGASALYLPLSGCGTRCDALY